MKLLKTNAAIWFNKLHSRTKQLTPKYINIKINGHNQHSKNTKAAAIRFRITLNHCIRFACNSAGTEELPNDDTHVPKHVGAAE
jgi:hypothetical protein